jgi:hypothetical protein
MTGADDAVEGQRRNPSPDGTDLRVPARDPAGA